VVPSAAKGSVVGFQFTFSQGLGYCSHVGL